MFKTGEKVYYPGYGKAVIQTFVDREVMGVIRPYYMLKGLERDVTIMIPKEMIDKVGLKKA